MVVGFRKPEAVVGIFAFEVSSVMSKLVHLWESLGYEQVDRLRKFMSDSVGLKELVSHDTDFIRGLIRGELFENMIPLTKFVARVGKNHCSDLRLKDFEHAVGDLINHGVDPFGWVLPYEEMGNEAKKMESFMSVAAVLHDRMKLVSHLEGTRNHMDGPIWLEIQNKIELKRLDVAKLKEESLWNMNFNYIGILLARSVFTIFNRIKSVYGVPQLMAKDTGHTSSTPSPSIFNKYKLFDAPPDTLGAAALALKYADIVILIEYLVRSPVYVYTTRRDKLYNMLPAKMRAMLSERLPPVQSSTCSSIKDVAAEKNVAMLEMLEWLAPLAHNTNKCHSMWKRKQKAYASTRSHVLLVQTRYFASQQKTEAAIMELIVGLQYKRRAAEMLCGLEDKAEASIVLEESKSVTV
ncbi:PREDICTED: uncharacterized protein LOC101313168 [Fragaria vesca subsp. vesca]|uniref:uncharacterized protein LOC101313168 n=1 Tax=Fragaria vesca subsp. vesca TaxID=101020 RepID=UPI0002C2F65E|nr:PREDICTED: uncharacterized protein LOC101313168 [Fragaria vesca subsp. vesca]